MISKRTKELTDLEDVIYDLTGIKNLIIGLPSIADLVNGFDDACNVLADTLNEKIEAIREIYENERKNKKEVENDPR